MFKEAANYTKARSRATAFGAGSRRRGQRIDVNELVAARGNRDTLRMKWRQES
jgi:hypothetical protein